MATLQIRDLPDYIYNRLKEDARRERRSLSQQTAYILGKGLNLGLSNQQKRIKVLKSLEMLAEQTNSLDLSDPLLMIKADRKR